MVHRRKAPVIAALLSWLIAPAAGAQTVQAVSEREAATTVWTLRNWTRVEGWRFFEPPPGGGDNEYAYSANRLQAGGVRRGGRDAGWEPLRIHGLRSVRPIRQSADRRRWARAPWAWCRVFCARRSSR